jgi:hypothetical protein
MVVKQGISTQGREMRRSKFPAIQGLVRILRGRFEGQGKNQTKILMFTHSVGRETLCSVGDGPWYFDA